VADVRDASAIPVFWGLGAIRRGSLPATLERSTWDDVEEWRLIATKDESTLLSRENTVKHSNSYGSVSVRLSPERSARWRSADLLPYAHSTGSPMSGHSRVRGILIAVVTFVRRLPRRLGSPGSGPFFAGC